MKLNLINKKYTGLIVVILFSIWMLFFDANSYLYQLDHNRKIDKLEKSIKFYKEEISKNKKNMDKLSVQKNINNFARETYHYKKENEYLYLIEYDTIAE